MPDTIRRVDYYYFTVPNQPGEGARVLKALKDGGVNLLAVHGFPSGRESQLDVVPEDSSRLESVARAAGLKLSDRKSAFLIDGDDRPGAAAEIMQKLAGAGLNVVAVDAVRAGAGRFGGLLWVDAADVEQARQVLGAA
jgi:hypothetical protein